MLTKLHQRILFYEICEKKNNTFLLILKYLKVSVSFQQDFNLKKINLRYYALFVENNNV